MDSGQKPQDRGASHQHVRVLALESREALLEIGLRQLVGGIHVGTSVDHVRDGVLALLRDVAESGVIVNEGCP